MESKIMLVFYGNDCLPYRDSARSVHYPVVGSTFTGSNNTTQVRFYVRDIGGHENVTWVANSKLPNGKLGYKLLDTPTYDDELGEYYLALDLSSYYTSIKGDVYISLNGYQGGVLVEEDEDTGIYEISGTPTIQATGSIKISINYAPQLLPNAPFSFDDLQLILGYFSDYLKITSGIISIDDITDFDTTTLSSQQIVFDKTTKSFYKITDTSGNYTLWEKDYLLHLGTLDNSTTIAQLRALMTSPKLYSFKFGYDTYMGYVYKDNTNQTQLGIIAVTGTYPMQNRWSMYYNGDNDAMLLSTLLTTSSSNTYFKPLATKKEVLSEIASALVSYATITYVDSGLATKVDKTSDDNKVYGTNELGQQRTFDVDTDIVVGSTGVIVRREYPSGRVAVGNPTEVYHATTKKYVDDKINEVLGEFKENEISLVNTTTYPDLNSFLASTGQEGFIYLYPIDTSDLTKGYYRYVWEKVNGTYQWVSLGTTEIDLSNYVDLTSNQTISGTKTFSGDIKVQNIYGTDNTHYLDLSGYAIKFQRTIRPYANASLDIGSSSYKWKDLYLSGYLKDGTNSIQISEIATKTELTSYANIDDLEAGRIVVGKALTTQQIDNVSDESGETQETPFILQGTGTANGTASVDTSPIGKQLEKQGNTVCVNQLVYNPKFNALAGWNYNTGWSSVTASNGKATCVRSSVAGNAQIYQIIQGNTSHKYLAVVTLTASANCSVYMRFGDISNSTLVNLTANVKQTLYTLKQCDNANAEFNIYISSTLGDLSENDTLIIENPFCIDLTLWFGNNSLIPQDLLDHPENFFRYYQGSLAYNVGTMTTNNGRYLKTIGRQQWDEEWELGGIDTDTGAEVSTSNRIRAKNLTRVIPNTVYYGRTASQGTPRVAFYDKDNNYLGYASARNLTFTTPSNCVFIRVFCDNAYGTTYNHDITISLYYTTGDGYSEYYAYETPKVYDTGSEVLRSAGTIKDIKLPSGEITRKIGTYTFTGDETWSASGKAYYTSSANISNIVKKPTSDGQTANILCESLVSTSANNLYSNGDTVSGIAIQAAGNICIGQIDYANISNLTGKTIYFELETPTTETGTPFSENIEINDYGTMAWQSATDTYVTLPQGCKIFYPADYVLFIDSLGQRTDIGWDVSELVSQTELSVSETQRDNADTILQNAIGGTLRQCLCVKESLSFDSTAWVDLGTLNWTYDSTNQVFYFILTAAKSSAKILCSKYQNAINYTDIMSTNNRVFVSGDKYLRIKDTNYTNADTFKAAMKGVLLAYEKAS